MSQSSIIRDLRELACNVRWSWHTPTQRVFERADRAGFEAAHRNPFAWLRRTGIDRAAEQFARDPALREELRAVVVDLRADLAAPASTEPRVAYFCFEYGLHESLAIYAGGLGILAGDHVKEASDQRLDLVAVGLYYPDGYLSQDVDPHGWQVAHPAHNDRCDHPLFRRPETVTVHLPGGELHADVWELRVGRTRLFLLDPDVERNTDPALRHLCRRLYQADSTTRLRQELLLGVGGLRLLRMLGEDHRVLHLNEGHCAFALAEAVREEAGASGDWDLAAEAVRRRSVFTTHTPVAAGHDRFDAWQCQPHLEAAFGDERFAAWVQAQGVEPGRDTGALCMTVLALNLAARRNAVSEIHGHVSRAMWHGWEIGHVTNGVHASTWVADEIRARPADLGPVRRILRGRLVDLCKARFEAMPAERRTGTPECLRDDILTIGFARRFAPYKRATLLFSAIDRLARILTHPDRPVQILYAGKAHPADRAGQELMRTVIAAARDPRLRGHVHFIPDYDIAVGRALVQGCDVWLNTPRRPLEASGTSGQKAGMNGCLNASVGDGWWPEGYDGFNGWVVGEGVDPHAPDAVQDAADVASVFDLIEHTIAPLFYAPGDGWLAASRRSIETLTGKFSATRMLHDYIAEYYRPAGAGL